MFGRIQHGFAMTTKPVHKELKPYVTNKNKINRNRLINVETEYKM